MATYRKNNPSPSLVAGTFGLAIILAAGVLFLRGWLIMLIWGALGNEFGFFTVNFWQAVLISLGIGIVAGFFKRTETTSA